MYSVQQLGRIRNIEREQLRKIKEIENANKKVELLEDILDTKDFTFEKYSAAGDSGSLLLATSKKDKAEKYIVKHEYYDCACNEYMYSKIANEMNINVAPVKMFSVTNKKNIFKSDFVCGIKYYEDAQRVGYKYIENNKEQIENWKDYFKFKGMESLFFEADDIEIIKKDKFIYRIDTTAAFTLSHVFISHLAYEGEYDGIDIRKFAYDRIIKLANFNKEFALKTWTAAIEEFKEHKDTKYLQYYLEPFKLFLNIDEKKIEKWCDTICYFYPNIIGEYYKIYLENIKECIKKVKLPTE